MQSTVYNYYIQLEILFLYIYLSFKEDDVKVWLLKLSIIIYNVICIGNLRISRKFPIIIRSSFTNFSFLQKKLNRPYKKLLLRVKSNIN